MIGIEPWVALAIGAAAAQTVRFALQRSLAADVLTATGATWARFAFSAPIVIVLLLIWIGLGRAEMPQLTPAFFGWAALGGVCQILATVATVALFSHRAFAIGITLKKTEVLMTAIFGWVILGDRIATAGWTAIVLGLFGVLLLSSRPDRWSLDGRAVALGLGSGVFFALSAVGYRGSTLALETPDTVLRAGLALAVVTSGQALGLGLWLMARQPGEIAATLREWRRGLAVGVTSMTGSWCWFAAFSMANAAYVFAVGQIELIFSAAVGAVLFRERVTGREWIGMALLAGSILGIVFVA